MNQQLCDRPPHPRQSSPAVRRFRGRFGARRGNRPPTLFILFRAIVSLTDPTEDQREKTEFLRNKPNDSTGSNQNGDRSPLSRLSPTGSRAPELDENIAL